MTAIAKALTILEVVGSDEAVDITTLLAATGLPRSTLVRMIAECVERGFLERADRGVYRIGPTMRALVRNSDYDGNLGARAREQLKRLVKATGETAHYAVYDDGSSVYIDKVDGLHPIRSYTQIGGRSPAYATATGKVLLAWQSSDEIDRVARASKRFTQSTHSGLSAVRDEERRIRDQGHAVNRGEWRDGVWGIAAPVFAGDGKIVAALGISGPENRIRPNLASLTPTVIEFAAALSNGPGRPLMED